MRYYWSICSPFCLFFIWSLLHTLFAQSALNQDSLFLLHQTLGSSECFGVAFGDVDGNGTRDGIVVNFQDPSRLWNNDGTGKFSVSGQSFGSGTNHGGDLVDIDVVTGNSAFNGGVTKLWVNQSAPSTGEVILPVNTNDHLHVYPNPVIRDVTISFSLERETSLKLMLFDVSMRMVGLLAEGLFSQGEYRVMRVLDSFSDGLYHVLMLSDDSGSIHRILVKEAN